MSKPNEFFQQGPELQNQYDSDEVLIGYLRRKLPAGLLPELEPDLRKMGARAAGDMLALAQQAEQQPPRHVPFDAWGRRVDRIEVSPAWSALDRIAAEEGLIAIGYERKQGEWSRTYQLAKLYLFHPSSAIYSCPLAMTDGAARAIELYGDEGLKEGPFKRLTSRDPARFWTSGQWMTERTGGSDVSGTSTVAQPDSESQYSVDGYRLHGAKWFTSATTSQMAMTLARIEGAEAGSRGLSLFYLELRDPRGALDGIRIDRLKDKLGTKALPTAELTLQGTPACLVGGPGNGVRKIASLFNITRVYNSVCAIGYFRRGLALARDYAARRDAFGRKLADLPLHVETLAKLEVDFRASFQLTFRMVELLGRDETGKATPAESALLRLLTPVVKLYTAKQTIAGISEVLESFGGAGYVEDTGLPRLLRDAQVLSIWEGTTNVLSLDALRAIEREGALPHFLADVRERVGQVRAPEVAGAATRVLEACARIEAHVREVQGDALVGGARAFAYALARTYAASLLLEQAEFELADPFEKASRGAGGLSKSAIVARRWCERELAPLVRATPEHLAASKALT